MVTFPRFVQQSWLSTFLVALIFQDAGLDQDVKLELEAYLERMVRLPWR